MMLNPHIKPLTYERMEATENAAANVRNDVLHKRSKYTMGGASVELLSHWHCDIFNQDEFLLNAVEMRIRLVRSKDTFVLMDATGGFAVHFQEASLIVRKVRISPQIILAHANGLGKTTAKYPITRVEVKAFTMRAGVMHEALDNVVLGQLPKKIIIGLVDNRAREI